MTLDLESFFYCGDSSTTVVFDVSFYFYSVFDIELMLFIFFAFLNVHLLLKILLLFEFKLLISVEERRVDLWIT